MSLKESTDTARRRALLVQQELIDAGAEAKLVRVLDVYLGHPWMHEAGCTFPHACYVLHLSRANRTALEDQVYVIVGDDLHCDFFGCNGDTWQKFQTFPYPEAPIFQDKVLRFAGSPNFKAALAILKNAWMVAEENTSKNG